jgi:Tfp pilus assembly protein PilV
MIIASLLLVIGVSAALAAIGASTRTTGYANQTQTAALLAQRQIAETAANPSTLASGGDSSGTFDDPYSSYHWSQSVQSTDYQNLFQVTVTVTWGNGPNPYSREITTYLRSDTATVVQQEQTNYTSYQTNQAASSSGTTTGGTTSGP